MRAEHLMKRDTPTGAVIAPEPHNVRRLLLNPGLRLRAVLFFESAGLTFMVEMFF